MVSNARDGDTINVNLTGINNDPIKLKDTLGKKLTVNLTGTATHNVEVDMSGATVNNKAAGTFTITNVSGNTWNENVTGNTIVFNDPDAETNLVVGAGVTVGSLTLKTPAKVTVPSDATVSSLTVETGAAGSAIDNAGTIAKIAGTGSVEVSGGGEITQTNNPSVTVPTAGPADQVLTKGNDLIASAGVYSASFDWSSTNGVGTKLVEKSGRYNYFNDGAYLDITVKGASGDNIAFDTLFKDMTLVTDGGNVDSIKGTGGRQAEDWAGTDGQWKTKLKADGSKSVFYGVRQAGTGTAVGTTRTVGFNAGDNRTIDLKLTPKADIADGTYTVTIQPKQQTGVTTGVNLGEAITYTFTVEAPEVIEPTIDEAIASRNDSGDIVLTVKANGQNLKSLEVDHSHGNHGKWASANLPEFTVYPSTENPWGYDESKNQATAAGVEALYNADTQTWTLTLKSEGQAMTVINGDISNGAFEFYLVVNDQVGNSSGDMNGNYKKVVVEALN